MKKVISILVLSALVMLSFAFIPSKHKVEKKTTQVNNQNSEPIGGFLSEDK